MKIKILDSLSLGEDLPYESLSDLGEVEIYGKTEPDEINSRISDADVIIINKIKITRQIIENMKKTRLICVFATGYDNIDTKAAREYGVAVCNVPAYSTESVMLFTVSTALSLIARLREYSEFVASGEYSASGVPNKLTPVYHEISGKTWGIIGLGNIGKRVAEVASALGARVIVNKVTPKDGYECVDIDTLCRQSDIISIHCPLNEKTRSLINKERIDMMKRGVVLVNEARGAVVDEAAVADAVVSGKIGAFGCDVYSTEPFGKDHPYYRIRDMKNVCLTPHAAWGAYESRVRCLNVIINNIKAFVSGKIQNRVDI